MKKDKLIENIEVIKKALKIINYKEDKCKGYTPGCINCQNQILIGLLVEYLWGLKDELKDSFPTLKHDHFPDPPKMVKTDHIDVGVD